MKDGPALSRSLIRRAENTELSLMALEAIAQLRACLDQLEAEAFRSARDKGATVEDIAEALGLTKAAIYHRMKMGSGRVGAGRPKHSAAS